MREQRRNGRKRIRSAAAVLCAGMLLTGCGAGSEPSYTKQGMDAVAALDYGQALALFQTAREKGEEERLIYRGMGLAYLGQTDYEAAIAYLETALTLGGSRVEDIDFDINYYLAAAYYKNGQFEEAMQAYDAILSLRPNETNAYYLRGCVKLSEGDFESAQLDFDTAVAKEPQNYDQMIRIYMVLEEYGYKEAGQIYLENAMKENERSISDYDMGRICYYMGNYENARNFLERLKTTTDYGAALYLGRTYEALGDYNYAASIYAGYAEYDQTKAEIYNQLGLCRMRMGEYESALTAFQTAMNIENNEMMQTLKFNEIITYEYMRDFKTAAALMNSYLKSYPDDETAKREYQFLQTR
ncbi:MAG: tetratricopeptide repeat protein [Bacteroidales bacterium]|nr:tetratricopeptide repeat protein [Bacteroidales bacterium]MCM1414678.1 tetratricopeptide repeat protein [bacterium]MCM1424960.1 tetratricopeptide repeat protein [bacterium]